MESFLDLLQHLWNGDVWGFLLENKFKTCSFAALLLVVYFVYQIAQEPIKAIKSFYFSASITITEHQQNFDMMDAFAGKLIGVDRAGINWVADTYHTNPLNSQMTREQDKSTGFWRFQKAHTDTEMRYNIGYGTWWFLWRQRLVFLTKTAPEAGQAAMPATIRVSITFSTSSFSPRLHRDAEKFETIPPF